MSKGRRKRPARSWAGGDVVCTRVEVVEVVSRSELPYNLKIRPTGLAADGIRAVREEGIRVFWPEQLEGACCCLMGRGRRHGQL